jgi:hypothetical protein
VLALPQVKLGTCPDSWRHNSRVGGQGFLIIPGRLGDIDGDFGWTRLNIRCRLNCVLAKEKWLTVC